MRLLVQRDDELNRNAPEPDHQARPGDIVVIEDDGWEWGEAEQWPTFTQVNVPGPTRDEGLAYAEPLTVREEEAPGEFNDRTVVSRKFGLALNRLSFQERADFDAGSLTMTLESFLRTIEEKATGTSEWDRGVRTLGS